MSHRGPAKTSQFPSVGESANTAHAACEGIGGQMVRTAMDGTAVHCPKHGHGVVDGRAHSENSDPLLDATTAAAYLGLVGVVKHPAQAVRSLCRKRRIRSTKVAGKVMVRRSWLEQYISENVRDVYRRNA